MNKELLQVNNDVAELEPDELTAEEIVFSRLLAKGVTPSTAYRKAFPLKKNLAYGTIRNYARELMQKDAILSEVATSQRTSARLARLAEDRIEQILTDDDSQAKGSKVADVAMFMYDHANGKAVTKIQAESKHVMVTYNLGGQDVGEVPQEILDQLAD